MCLGWCLALQAPGTPRTIGTTGTLGTLRSQLKIVFHSKLHDPRAAQRRSGLSGDTAERPRVEDEESRLRIPPVEVVQQVERLEAKLQPLRRANPNHPRHSEVDVPVVRPDQRIARKVAERTGGWLGKRV